MISNQGQVITLTADCNGSLRSTANIRDVSITQKQFDAVIRVGKIIAQKQFGAGIP